MLATSRQPFLPSPHIPPAQRPASSATQKAGARILASLSARSKEAPMEFEYDSATAKASIFATACASSTPDSSPAPEGKPEQAGENSKQITQEAGRESGEPSAAGRNTSGVKRSRSSAAAPPVTDQNTSAFGGPFLFSPPSTAASHFTSPSRNFLANGIANLRVRTLGNSPPEPLAGHALKKVRRRRAQAGDKYWRVRDSDDEEDGSGSEGDSKNESGSPRHGFFTPKPPPQPSSAVDHHSLPYVISGYLQLTFNIFVVAVLGYLVMVFIKTVQRDVDLKVEEYSAEILQEMSQCSKKYLENRCTPGDRVPAMEQACRAWESCMNRDPTVVGRAKVSAETFAEIINSFVEPISYKTMAFCIFLIFGSILVSNLAFGFYRTWSTGAGHHGTSRGAPHASSPPPAAQIHVHSGPPPFSWNPRRRRPRTDSSERSPSSRTRRIAL